MARIFAIKVAVATVALALLGCGDSGDSSSSSNKRTTYRVQIEQASFPLKQHLAQQTIFKLTVRNPGTRPLPNVAVTVNSFARQLGEPGLSDSAKPIWVIDKGPVNGETAYTNTWSLGRLDPGHSRSFVWHVTPLTTGSHTVKYKVLATLKDAAQTLLEDNSAAEGSFTVTVSPKAAKAQVGSNGQVVRSY